MIQSRLNDKDKKKSRERRLIFSGIFSVLILCSLYFFFHESNPVKPPEPESKYQILEGSIEENSTLYQSLMEKNISYRWIDLIISKLKPFLDFNRLRGGTYRFVANMEGELVKFVFEKSPTEVYKIEKGDEGYVAQKKEISLERYLVKVSGEIRSSLYEAMNVVGEQDLLALSFADILAWEIDFYQDLREGDRFKLVVEKFYRGDQFVQYGLIDALEYQRGDRMIRGFRYGNDYYNERGVSLRRPFLKAPLRFDRISSRFSHARRHPILGGTYPHYGVDYAAPAGIPVWAVADGTVVSVGWNGGFGKQVVLRHMNRYKTYYGHLSKYGTGIKNGAQVRQKQVIGYVGSTGLSTGPHLDYRLSKDGKFLNPLMEVFPSGYPIQKKDLKEFHQKRDEMLAGLTSDALFQMKLGETTIAAYQKD
jgi:murein DD-endopeptidase MepM/ murein hydrolase activator NlpD